MAARFFTLLNCYKKLSNFRVTYMTILDAHGFMVLRDEEYRAMKEMIRVLKQVVKSVCESKTTIDETFIRVDINTQKLIFYMDEFFSSEINIKRNSITRHKIWFINSEQKVLLKRMLFHLEHIKEWVYPIGLDRNNRYVNVGFDETDVFVSVKKNTCFKKAKNCCLLI